MKCIIFDLDGTLTCSGEGIMKSAVVTFEHFGLTPPSESELLTFVGPPLRDSFLNHGIDKGHIDEAIKVYRSRYNTVGKFENYVYDGIETLLKRLKGDGYRLFVATAKPEEVSVEILEHFGLLQYFEKVCGASPERIEKADIIKHLLNSTPDITNAVMVGDTMTDVNGAKENNIPTVAVLWGYGDKAEISNFAYAVAGTTDELYEILKQ